MNPGWLIKNYSYILKTTAPTTADIDYPLSLIWVNITSGNAYILDDIADGAATWTVKQPDSIINNGTGNQINVIGEKYTGELVVTSPGAGQIPNSNAIISDPAAGEYRITNLRVDQNHKLVATYDEAPA